MQKPDRTQMVVIMQRIQQMVTKRRGVNDIANMCEQPGAIIQQ